MRWAGLALCGSLTAHSPLHAQTALKGTTPAAAESAKTPVFVLDVDKAASPSFDLKGRIGSEPMACLAEGSIGMDTILLGPADPELPDARQILDRRYAIFAPDGTEHFLDPALINDITPPFTKRPPIDFDIGAHDAVFLYFANIKVGDNEYQTHWYVARFDLEGGYHGALPIEVEHFIPYKIAVLDSGDILVFGIDGINHKAQLLLLSAVGGKVHYLQAETDFAKEARVQSLPLDTEEEKVSVGQDEVELMKMEQVTNSSQMAHYRDSIILLQPNSDAPLFIISPQGIVRTIPLPETPGLNIGVVIPSDEGLYLRYYGRSTNRSSRPPQVLLQLDPNTGAELGRIFPGEIKVECVHQGRFSSLKFTDASVFQILSATARPQ